MKPHLHNKVLQPQDTARSCEVMGWVLVELATTSGTSAVHHCSSSTEQYSPSLYITI